MAETAWNGLVLVCRKHQVELLRPRPEGLLSFLYTRWLAVLRYHCLNIYRINLARNFFVASLAHLRCLATALSRVVWCRPLPSLRKRAYKFNVLAADNCRAKCFLIGFFFVFSMIKVPVCTSMPCLYGSKLYSVFTRQLARMIEE